MQTSVDKKSLENLFKQMDDDCVVRVLLSALSGKSRFLAQLSLECQVMKQREDCQETCEIPELISCCTEPKQS